MDALIFETFERVQAETDEAKREQLKQDTAEELGRHFLRFPHEWEELAYDLLDITWSDAQKGDIVRDIIEVKTVGLGEPDYLEEDLRGMRAFWQGKGGQIRSGIIRYERQQMPREEMVWGIDLHRDEIRLNFWGTVAKLTQQARDKMATLPAERLVELIQALITSGVTFGSFAGSGLTAAQVESVVKPVAARNGGKATILGTPMAIRTLSDIGLAFGPNVQEDVFKTGIIGVFKGWQVAQVENFENFDGDFVLPDNELWIVGRKAGRLTYYGGDGDTKIQTLAQPSFMSRTESARDAGMLLINDPNKARIGRIVLT